MGNEYSSDSPRRVRFEDEVYDDDDYDDYDRRNDRDRDRYRRRRISSANSLDSYDRMDPKDRPRENSKVSLGRHIQRRAVYSPDGYRHPHAPHSDDDSPPVVRRNIRERSRTPSPLPEPPRKRRSPSPRRSPTPPPRPPPPRIVVRAPTREEPTMRAKTPATNPRHSRPAVRTTPRVYKAPSVEGSTRTLDDLNDISSEASSSRVGRRKLNQRKPPMSDDLWRKALEDDVSLSNASITTKVDEDDTPRNGYTNPRQNEYTPTPRQNEYTPTPRQNDNTPTPRQNGYTIIQHPTPRNHGMETVAQQRLSYYRRLAAKQERAMQESRAGVNKSEIDPLFIGIHSPPKTPAPSKTPILDPENSDLWREHIRSAVDINAMVPKKERGRFDDRFSTISATNSAVTDDSSVMIKNEKKQRQARKLHHVNPLVSDKGDINAYQLLSHGYGAGDTHTHFSQNVAVTGIKSKNKGYSV